MSRGGANIEAKNHDGDTPLHWASWIGYLAIVKRLRSSGADILATSNQGKLPIHKVLSFRMSEVAKYLLRHFYATTRHPPLHELLEGLTWIPKQTKINL
jgi:ankyrin repeat protein